MGGGAGGGGIDPKIKQRKIEMYSELNRQLLLAQLQGLGGGPGLSRSRRQNPLGKSSEERREDEKAKTPPTYKWIDTGRANSLPGNKWRRVPYTPDLHRPTDTIVGKQGRQMYSN